VLAPTDWPARLATRLGASHAVQVERHEVEVPASLGAANALRIAFASDFHAGPTTSEKVFDRAAQLLADAGADLLLLGGDFVSLRAGDARRLIGLLGQIPAPLGRFAVLGNHDHWTDAPAIVDQLRGAGIRVLTNDHLRLPAPFEDVSVCGLDDHTSGEPDAAAAFADIAPVRIVLMHAPSGLLDIGDRPFTVALCGHTHGGQIALWNGRPLIVAHGRLSRRYSAGRFRLEDGRVLLVSRGLGCGLLPIRFNAPAAVLLCTLRGAVDARIEEGPV
jgi:predicted MPP superfamily phosphohydrolase